MELLQLQYFLEVARLEHVTEAARSLHVTQSSLSKTIQRLEEDLGVPLFDRTGRKLRLNEFGNKFIRRAERALFELEQGKQEISDLSRAESGTLKLAVTTASTLPQIMREFRKNVLISISCANADHAGNGHAFASRRSRFLLVVLSFSREDIECQVVYVDPILVAVPNGHRLADRGSVCLTELKDECFVGVKRGYGTRDLVDAVCKSAGIDLQYVYEGDEPTRLITLVEAEIGLAFIPSTAKISWEKIKYLQVENHELVRDIALLWHKSRYMTQASLEFRKVVLDYFEAISNPSN